MPEKIECEAAGVAIMNFINDQLRTTAKKLAPHKRDITGFGRAYGSSSSKSIDPRERLRVKAIWADATTTEQGDPDAYGIAIDMQPRARAGHVHMIDSNCTYRRGPKNNQGLLYPQVDNHPVYDPTSLVLDGIRLNSRNCILDLDKCWCQVQLLLHCLPQIYEKADWYGAVTRIPSKDRGFIVSIAFELEDYVLAFTSKDNLMKAHYANTDEELPAQHVDVVKDFVAFCDNLVVFLSERREEGKMQRGKSRRGHACDVVRENSDVFPGVGTYSVEEVFFRAGLSPFLEEHEVFDCPSRVARLVEAYWCHSHMFDAKIQSWLKKYTYKYMMARTRGDREDFTRFLKVWGKENIMMSARLGKAVDTFNNVITSLGSRSIWVRDAACISDAFEPSLLREALADKDLDLFHLILGPTLYQSAGLGVYPSADHDPLTAFFTSEGLMDVPTFLNDSLYVEELFLDDSAMISTSRPTLNYRVIEGKARRAAIWCAVHPFPKQSRPPQLGPILAFNPAKVLVSNFAYEVVDKKRFLFTKYTRKGQDVAIGPLEFCSAVRLVKKTGQGSGYVAIVCKDDPRVDDYYLFRAGWKGKRGKKGNRLRLPLSDTWTWDLPVENATLEDDEGKENLGPPPAKKRRLCADQRLALSSVN